MRPIAYIVTRDASAPVERLFDVVTAEDVLPKVLHRFGPVPGVTGTRDLTGPWDHPGSSRTVVLQDGSTARETLLDHERPRRFAYRVEDFTSAVGRVADHAIGTWNFEPTPTGSRFIWTYAFTPRGAVTRPLLALVVRTAWGGYMSRCADRCVALAEA